MVTEARSGRVARKKNGQEGQLQKKGYKLKQKTNKTKTSGFGQIIGNWSGSKGNTLKTIFKHWFYS